MYNTKHQKLKKYNNCQCNIFKFISKECAEHFYKCVHTYYDKSLMMNNNNSFELK